MRRGTSFSRQWPTVRRVYVDWLIAVLQFPNSKEAGFFLVVLVLILVMDRRMSQMVKSTERLHVTVEHHMAHQTSRMGEIRNAMMRVARDIGRLAAGDEEDRGHRGQESGIH